MNTIVTLFEFIISKHQLVKLQYVLGALLT